MKKILILLFALTLVLGTLEIVRADSFSGAIIGATGTLIGTDGWSDAQLGWTVNNTSNPGFWTYEYDFVVYKHDQLKELSHIIFEVSPSFGPADLNRILTTPSFELRSDTTPPKTTWGPSDSGNPSMPGSIPGLKFGAPTPTGDGSYFLYEIKIVTTRGPMWGDFYAKDGTSTGVDVVAWNKQFLFGTNAVIDNGNAGGWVLVPDTATVPEPGILILLGIAMSAIGAASWKISKF